MLSLTKDSILQSYDEMKERGLLIFSPEIDFFPRVLENLARSQCFLCNVVDSYYFHLKKYDITIPIKTRIIAFPMLNCVFYQGYLFLLSSLIVSDT